MEEALSLSPTYLPVTCSPPHLQSGIGKVVCTAPIPVAPLAGVRLCTFELISSDLLARDPQAPQFPRLALDTCPRRNHGGPLSCCSLTAGGIQLGPVTERARLVLGSLGSPWRTHSTVVSDALPGSNTSGSPADVLSGLSVA